jgi:glutamate dehydrogenase
LRLSRILFHFMEKQMTHQSQALRKQTLDLVMADAAKPASGANNVAELIDVWLTSLEDEDLAGITPHTLPPVLWEGFARAAKRSQAACQIETLRYTDERGAPATAMLVVNPDMPFLVDSMVMALRRLRIGTRAVLNAVLSVQRASDGSVAAVAPAKGGGYPLESFVLCLLSDPLGEDELSALTAAIRMVAADAAAVQRDAPAIADKLSGVANAVVVDGGEGQEAAAFLDWARNGGFEAFGYAFYSAVPGASKMVRDLPSRIGVLRDTSHPVYDKCLAGIPEDYETLGARHHVLSVVKADSQSTLHRDQQLDFIGVRARDGAGNIMGEHTFVGLFSRSAATTPLKQMPFARGRIKQVLNLAGVRQEGFRAEKFIDILESLPRTEVLEATPEWLAKLCDTVVALYKQPRARVFARADVYGRHLNVLVYMPRERYSANLSERLAHGLKMLSGASDVRVQTQVSDGPLARLFLIAVGARHNLELEGEVERPLLAAVEGWHVAFEEAVNGAGDPGLRSALRRIGAELSAEYIAATAPQTAYGDLTELLGSGDAGHVKVRIELAPRAAVNIRLLSVDGSPSLSQILPALQNAGIAVDREQTHQIPAPGGRTFFVTSLAVDAPSATKLARPEVTQVAQELFEALLNDEAEDGRMNGLVIEAGLRLKEVQVIRAYASYLRQAGVRYSMRYMADCLRKQPSSVRVLIDSFVLRFDLNATPEQRAAAAATLNEMKQKLTAINHADTEDILRSLADLILATVRTSYFQSRQTGDTILFKFDTTQLTLLPQPRPHREIFVFSRRFEGVHLRGGPVARGGLRWSDRMEDYRTEVLGLVKAQMVKNSVIVPVGAKGGFVCKMMPKNATREMIAAEGEAVYRLFINGLLDLTDNRVRGAVVPPPETVRYDGDDTYLVVAADKGTATFSDIANGIAVERGFWLGDAFASGGSNGYDHKKLGITARGAWEAVKRHFYEMGHDLNTTPITAVGIGDMSGDVFGNGVLLSRQLKLVAAFDHRHIFLDPNPDVEVSFRERQRMFALPRSSWEDYDKGLISQGGGVWPRSARSIELSPEARAALGTEAASATPEELMHLILLAPVDLFYNGGIGTYIKASTETHEQVKDRANDAIRVDGNQLRCKVVGEGGNLGATQAGRIEFALKGGHIFTDAIDNSAGVDCSDHEVNLKIWLDTEVAAGKLNEAERNKLLTDVTDDICVLVLRDNELQTHLLAREEQGQQDAAQQDGYAALITALAAEGVLSRGLEKLPSESELARRKAEGRGLTAPEIAVVVAYVKNRYKSVLATLPLLEQPWARTLATPYFPQALVATRDPLSHPLANTILATVLANEVVNRCGPLLPAELARRHGVKETDVICAWAQAWAALNLAPLFAGLDAAALQMPVEMSKALDQRTRALQKAVIEGVLSVPQEQLRTAGAVDELTRLFSQPDAACKLVGAQPADAPAPRTSFEQACQTVEALEGIADFLFAALPVRRPAKMSLAEFLQLGMRLRRESGIDRLERTLMHTPCSAAQEALRGHALAALRQAQQRLLARLLQQLQGTKGGPDKAIQAVLQAGGVALHAEAGTGLEQAVLAAWTLSEAVAPLAAAA